MPRKPVTVPVPPLLIVIEPTLLSETFTPLTRLKSRIPWTGAVLAVSELALTTIVEEPSRLPIVFPLMFAGASVAVDPLWIPIKAPRSDRVLARLLVWLIPEIVLF